MIKKILFILVVLLLITIIWFLIPLSPTQSKFEEIVNERKENYDEKGVYRVEDFAHLPVALQKSIENGGFIGKPRAKYMNMYYEDVKFAQSVDGPALSIDYDQFNFSGSPARVALIDSQVMGIPFEGLDIYIAEKNEGEMRGVIGKLIPLFAERGAEVAMGAQVNYLAETLFLPTAILSDSIRFEEIGPHQVFGEISYGGVNSSGHFYFNEEYELQRFYTERRPAVASDGSVEYIPWSAECSDYQTNEDGLRLPTHLKAIWHYPEGDFVYFDGRINHIRYGD